MLGLPGQAADLADIMDTSLSARLWESVHPGMPPPTGDYQVLWPDGRESGGGAVLLLNGTETGRLPQASRDTSASPDASAAKDPNDHALRRGGAGFSGRVEPPTIWEALKMDREKLRTWTEWPAGLRFRLGGSVSGVPSVDPQFEKQFDLEWSQKIHRHFLLGAGVHRTEFGGGLSRRLGAAELESESGVLQAEGKPPQEFWSDPYWWWSLAVAAPGLSYGIYLANGPLPRYYWLETSAASVIGAGSRGKVVDRWWGSAEHGGNLAQSLDLRFSHLRYGIHWDGDAYRVPIQNVFLEDLPFAFGRWGGGLMIASDILATRMWMDVLNWDFSMPRPRAYPTDVRMGFLHVGLAYRNLKSFSLTLALTLRLDNRILNLPGAKS